MEESLKTALDNHANYVTDLDCVLLQRILEIYEKHEIWKTYFQGKSETDKDAQNDKTTQNEKKGQTREMTILWNTKGFF